MVFPGFLFHHVFLDCNGSTVRVGSRYFQTIEGTFRRRAIIRMIVTISRVRRTEKSYYKKQSIAKLFIDEEPCGEELHYKTVVGKTERVKVIEGCS